MNTSTEHTDTTMSHPPGETISISDTSKNDNFDNFGLDRKILKGIYRYGWEKPSPIQEIVIPAFIKTDVNPNTKKKRRDVIGQAQSGTGKTGAFIISVLQNLELDISGTQAIVLSPTRELAMQTNDVCTELSQNMNPKTKPLSGLFVGGNYRKDDINKLKKDVKVVIGTPGRIIDMIKSLSLVTNNITMLILDEADDLLSQGFADQIHEIFMLLPKTIQVGLFSATMSSEVLLLTNKFMQDPIRFLKEKEELSLKAIKQYQIHIPSDDNPMDDNKLDIILDLYGSMEISQAVIFCNMRKKVEILSQKLKEKDFSCITMHSDMSKQERESVMSSFRKGEKRILIATDVMARGIDVHHVSIVVNFDIPNNKENFLHRSGRAGRYGRKGLTINLVSDNEVEKIKGIEEHFSIEIKPLPMNFIEELS